MGENSTKKMKNWKRYDYGIQYIVYWFKYDHPKYVAVLVQKAQSKFLMIVGNPAFSLLSDFITVTRAKLKLFVTILPLRKWGLRQFEIFSWRTSRKMFSLTSKTDMGLEITPKGSAGLLFLPLLCIRFIDSDFLWLAIKFFLILRQIMQESIYRKYCKHNLCIMFY